MHYLPPVRYPGPERIYLMSERSGLEPPRGRRMLSIHSVPTSWNSRGSRLFGSGTFARFHRLLQSVESLWDHFPDP